MTALITLSHGSRHPGAAAGIERLTQAAAAAIPARPAYRAAHLEFNTPDLTAAAVDLAESTVSHHLGQLRTAGFVTSQRQGMSVHHTPRRDALTALCRVLDPDCC